MDNTTPSPSVQSADIRRLALIVFLTGLVANRQACPACRGVVRASMRAIGRSLQGRGAGRPPYG
ncbi:hypothetical protein, partial [Streptomyces goshikiensis]|uniref:hypothetical protein n=1 Tax=Streptomyces goshikiensis TaxID=1942 RepID=UPI003652F66B